MSNEESTRYVTWDVHNEFSKRIEDENDRQNHRISNLEDTVKQIQDLTIAVKSMSGSIDRMVKQLEKQGERLDAIEREPAQKWKNAVWIVIAGLIGAALSLFLSRVGL